MGYRLVSMAANSVHYKEIKLKPNKILPLSFNRVLKHSSNLSSFLDFF